MKRGKKRKRGNQVEAKIKKLFGKNNGKDKEQGKIGIGQQNKWK